MENKISHRIYEIIEEAKKISSIHPNKSFELSMEAYNMSRAESLKEEEGYALVSMAFSCRANSEINNMLKYSFQALDIFEAVGNVSGQISAFNLIGIAYFYNSIYEDSLKYLLQASDLLNTQKNDFLHSCVLNNIGEVYRESNVYGKAMEYFDEALKICKIKGYSMNMAAILGNMGDIYLLENKYSEALDNFNKSYNILIKEHDMISLGEAENRLGKGYYFIGNREKAEEYYFCSLNRLNNINNKYYAIDTLVNLATLYVKKDLNKAIKYYETAMHYARDISSSKKLSEVYRLISEYYENIEDYKAAIEYYKKYSHINEEIIASNLGNKLEIMKIELEYIKESDKCENIKRMLEKEIKIQKNELNKIKKSNEILEKKAYEDELTEVPNRRYINHYLNETWDTSIKTDEYIALFMIDIDNFKKYNDYWGHSCGDHCLKKVAKCLKVVQERRKDVLGRYGGEEFIYIARNISYDQALELGNNLRKEVQKLGLDYVHENERICITISVGGAIGKISDFKSYSNLLEISDKELYKAKDAGRNITLLKNILGSNNQFAII